MKDEQRGDEQKPEISRDLEKMFRDSDPLEGMGAIFWPLILAAAALIGILIFFVIGRFHGGG